MTFWFYFSLFFINKTKKKFYFFFFFPFCWTFRMFGRRHRVKSTSHFGCGHSPTWTSYQCPFWHHQGMISRTRLKKIKLKVAVFCTFFIVPQHRPAGDDAHVVGALQQRIGSVHRVGQRAGEGAGGCQRHVLPRASRQTHPHSGGAYSAHACLAGKFRICRICTLLS